MPKLSKKLLTEYLNSHSLKVEVTFNLSDITDLDEILSVERPKNNMTEEEIDTWIKLNLMNEITSYTILSDKISLSNMDSIGYNIIKN